MSVQGRISILHRRKGRKGREQGKEEGEGEGERANTGV
jgi:hypothetical protein